MKRITDILFSAQLMGSLLVLFALSISVATFIENDYGSFASRAIVYNSKWFEFLLLLVILNLAGNILRMKTYTRKKFSIFLFHMAFVLIFLGSVFTRYIGLEGVMHIREGNTSDQILSQNIYFKTVLDDGTDKISAIKNTRMPGLSDKKLHKTVKINGEKYQFELEEIIRNAVEIAHPLPEGGPIVSLIAFGNGFQESFLLREGESKFIMDLEISLNLQEESDIDIQLADTALIIRFNEDAVINSMTGESKVTLEKNKYYPLEKRKIYLVGDIQLVLQQFYEKAETKWTSAPEGTTGSGENVFVFRIDRGSLSKRITIPDRENNIGQEHQLKINDVDVTISYGRMMLQLPFSIRLEDFILERYPGSNSPSSFTSEVTLLDEENNLEKPFRIYMNKVLKHKGYRFYQSSYDKDELGTVLSVNHDMLGKNITYTGYFLMVLGIILTLMNKNSRFRSLARNASTNSLRTIILILGIIFGSVVWTTDGYGQQPGASGLEDNIIPYVHSKEFGKLLVQDINGRIKPVNTLASDIIRKISKKEKFSGLHPTQILLGMLSDPGNWQNIPLIKVGNTNLAKAIGITGEYASFMDFIDMEKRGEYKIASFVNQAYGKSPRQRDKFDKEVISVDERVNISYMIYTGTILDVFPASENANNKWYSSEEAYLHVPQDDSLFVRSIMQLYFQEITESAKSGNWDNADEYLNAITAYQYRNAGSLLPSGGKTRMEIVYNNVNVFKKLFPVYSLLGFILLIILIIRILVPEFSARYLVYGAVGLLYVGFAAHTFGLASRWYISGHAPWSNGYESMIYVAWATMLAGFIFSKKSLIALSATSILASLTLLVSHFSWMNPEITNLAPVLKSYWLTFHVSIITASYGFLGLGALLGFLNLILILLKTVKNRNRIEDQIEELSRINEMTLILGLYFLVIGTILGAVWANESWGRYWGWDPKETWSLVTILVYTFITHMRQIPGLRSTYSFNLSALIGFGSVMMTYFGVNYYLSGLHSYAQGDPVPVPSFVYYLIVTILLLAVFAYSNERKFKIAGG